MDSYAIYCVCLNTRVEVGYRACLHSPRQCDYRSALGGIVGNVDCSVGLFGHGVESPQLLVAVVRRIVEDYPVRSVSLDTIHRVFHSHLLELEAAFAIVMELVGSLVAAHERTVACSLAAVCTPVLSGAEVLYCELHFPRLGFFTFGNRFVALNRH